MELLLDKLINIFSTEYMFSVIIASYFVIKIVDALNGDGVVPSWVKRVITCVVGSIFFVLFKVFTDETFECLVSSFFAAVFVYDSAIKTIVKKLRIGYKE